MIGVFLCSVLDDLGLPHLHCVKVVLGVNVHGLFNDSLLDLVMRFPIFSWSLRVRDLPCDFRNSGDLLLLSTESGNLDQTSLIDLWEIDRRLDQPSLLASSS